MGESYLNRAVVERKPGTNHFQESSGLSWNSTNLLAFEYIPKLRLNFDEN
jgi:hypothetical protein